MIPEDGKVKALLLDLISLTEIPFPKWRALENYYSILYVERYTDTRSILLWTPDTDETITLHYDVLPHAKAKEILQGAEKLLSESIRHMMFVSADRSLCEEFLSYPCMCASCGDVITLHHAHSCPDIHRISIHHLYDMLKEELLFMLGDAVIGGLRGIDGFYSTYIYSYGHTPLLLFCGRYYGQEHFLWRMDAYSEGLRRIAAGEGVDALYREVLQRAIGRIHMVTPLDGIMSIPPKPGEADKFAGVLNEIEEKTSIPNMSSAFRCVKTYPSLWRLNKKEREDAVMNAFEVTAAVKGKHILLIDDVVSTGTTMEECFQTLLQRGAGEITLLALGVAQNARENLWGTF